MGCKPIPGDTSGTERPAGLISRKCDAKEGPRLTDSNGSSAAIGRVSISACQDRRSLY